MPRYRNPATFIMAHDIPFNFGNGWEDFDRDYHDPDPRWEMLKPKSDPCQWSDEFKAEVNAQRDEWVRMYKAWCGGDDE